METYCDGWRHTHTHKQYLSGYTLAGTVLQKEPYHLKVILLGCHVQRSEAILHVTWKKNTFTNMVKKKKKEREI